MKRLNKEKISGNIIILVILSGALFIGTCGFWDLWGPDEGRYVQIAKELQGQRNWFLLTVHDVPYDQKPPLPFWLFAGILKLSGGQISSWALRLPSALFAVVLVLLTYGIGRHCFNTRAGWMAALVCLTTPIVLDNASTVKLDMMYAGWICLSLYPWLTREENKPLSWARAAVMWGALTGAFFTKGPLAILIILSVLITDAFHSRSWKKILYQSRLLPGLTALFICIAGWLWIQSRGVSTSFVEEQVKGETLNRLLHGSHEEPFWYYIPRLFTAIMFPWALIPVPASFVIWNQRKSLPSKVVSLLGWFLPPFLLLCIAHGKRQTYVLPLIPPLALLVGWKLDEWTRVPKSLPRLSKAIGWLFAALSLIIVSGSVLLLFRPDIVWNQEVYVTRFMLILTLMFGVFFSIIAMNLMRRARTGNYIFYCIVISIFMFAIVSNVVVNPSLNLRKSTKQFSNGLQRRFPALSHNGKLGAIGKADKTEYHVYGNYNVIPIEADSALIDEMDKLPELVLIREKDKSEFAQDLIRGGYEEAYADIASGDYLCVYQRVSTESNQTETLPVRVAFAGDFGDWNEHQLDIAQQIFINHREHPLNAIFLLGDNIYSYGDFKESIEKILLIPYEDVINAGVPFHAVLGNHDYKGGFVNDEINLPEFGMNGRRYYSETFGDNLITFFCLDSESLKRDPEQVHWFKSRLKTCKSKWKVMMMHRPIYCSDSAHGPSVDLYRLLISTLTQENGIDAVFAGHNHFYERQALHDGILFVISGSAGKLTDGPSLEEAEVSAEYDEMRSFVIVDIMNDQFSLKTVNELGQVIDAVTLQKNEKTGELTELSYQFLW